MNYKVTAVCAVYASVLYIENSDISNSLLLDEANY